MKIPFNKKGTTLIELLLYMSIFLVLIPILMSVAIYSMRTNQRHNMENEISFDSRFAIERIYDLIIEAASIDVDESRLSTFDNPEPIGRLFLNMQDGSDVIIELNPDTKKIEITEGGITSNLSSENAKVENLYFEEIEGESTSEKVILGLTVHMEMTDTDQSGIGQIYTFSANLEIGDYDGDGCLDATDLYPEDPNCCGNLDGDLWCDEQDNCPYVHTSDQDDDDGDGLGNACDFTPEGSGGSGSVTPYNCGSDQQLIDIINMDPPFRSTELKQLFVSSSPLSPDILNALIERKHNDDSFMNDQEFADIFIANMLFDSSIWSDLHSEDNLEPVHDYLADAWSNAHSIPILYDKSIYGEYDYILYSDDFEEPVEEWNNRIHLDATVDPLGEPNEMKTDYFEFEVRDCAGVIGVKMNNDAGESTVYLDSENTLLANSLGFTIELKEIDGNDYTITVSAVEPESPVNWIEFDFGYGADIIHLSGGSIVTERYVYYCPGGCDHDCGDGGSGILISAQSDLCYGDPAYPGIWCQMISGQSYSDDQIAGTSGGGSDRHDNLMYFEKTFQTILTENQLDKLENILVGGNLAYQNSTTNGFCDINYPSNYCLMRGDLINDQEVQLYDWDLGEWIVIGVYDFDEQVNTEQYFEVSYNEEDLHRFLNESNKIKARITFNWNGDDPSGSCNLLLDYFVMHLKWGL